MLPQSQALESTSADNSRVGMKRGVEPRNNCAGTGVQHKRGEPDPSGLRHSVSSETVRKGQQNAVFVLDRRGKPLQPTTPRRARLLLKSGRARVAKVMPFTIRIVDRTVAESVVQGVKVGIDPGSKTTGIAVFSETDGQRKGLFSAELEHRGRFISKKLEQRSNYRRRSSFKPEIQKPTPDSS